SSGFDQKSRTAPMIAPAPSKSWFSSSAFVVAWFIPRLLVAYRLVVYRAGILYRLGLCCHEAFDRRADGRVQPGATRFKMRKNCGAHSRVPEFFDVISSPGYGLFWTLTHEELANLIGHVN